MKKKLLFKILIGGTLTLAAFFNSFQARAQSFDFTYRDTSVVNSNSFLAHTIGLDFYQNCNSNYPVQTSIPSRYNVNNGTPVNEIITGNWIFSNGNPFCASQSAACTTTGPLNFKKESLFYTFSLKSNISTPGLYLLTTNFLVGGFGNFQAANIAGNFAVDPKLINAISNTFANVPPHFINPPVIFANVNQPVSFSTAAIDLDGDSLVYKLRPAGPAVTYATGFTYLNPITASPALNLNAQTGLITFTPTAFDATAGEGAVENKYVVGLDVDEYRKINGVVTKLATIQRNLLINVVSYANQAPALTADQQTQTIAPNTIIDVNPGSAITLNFTASDPDAGNTVIASSNATTVLPGAIFSTPSGQGANVGQLSWAPTTSDIRDEPYYFNVTALDDACPYPASITQTYGIRVRQVSGLKPEIKQPVLFSASPNPFNREVVFHLENLGSASGQLIIYNLLGQQLEVLNFNGRNAGGQEIRWASASQYPAGNYLVKAISATGKTQTLKLLKQQ